MQVRRLGVEDFPLARVMAAEAFGSWPTGVSPPPLPTELPPGRSEWGCWDGEDLVARVVTLQLESWFGGRRVPTCGVAGVSVAAEHRGGGLLAPLFEAAVAEALERGEVVSTLFPTATGIYRSLGYELVSSYDTVAVPTAELGRLRTADGVRTRRAGAADVPAIRATYDAWAAAQNGPLTRTGPRFPDDGLPDVSAVSLAVDADGEVRGFASWDRGTGYGVEATLTVHDLLATSAEAYRALWALAGSFASVTGSVRLSTSGADPARLVLPSMTWDVVGRHPYMLRVLDVPGTVAAMAPTLPAGGRAAVDLAVVGDRLGLLDGGYRLELSDDGATCERRPVVDGALTLTVQGLGLLVAGAQSCGNLRLLGFLHGGSPADDRALDAALGGRQLHIRDYF